MAFAFCIISCINYLKPTILPQPKRDLWQIEYNNPSDDPIVANSLLLFVGNKGEASNRCEYIYAVDKNTGSVAWSSESFIDQYCEHSQGPAYTVIISLSKSGDEIFVNTGYWTSDDNLDYIFYALNSSDGNLLWEVNGYANYYFYEYTKININNLYVVSKDGSFSAIDSQTGNQIWKQKISRVDYYENIIIDNYDKVVYYYYSGNDSLTAFDAMNGNQLWAISNLNYTNRIMFSDKLIYLISSSENIDKSNITTTGSPFSITALDTITGKQVWKLLLEQKFPPWVSIIENKIYVLTHDGQGMFDDFKTLRSLFVLDKHNGELLWQFNDNYLHGDINYLVQDNVVYIGTYDNFIFALDDETGKIIWQTQALGFPYYFYVEDSTLIVAYEKKYVSALDAKTGTQRWMLDAGMSAQFGYSENEFIIADNKVIYIADIYNPNVHAIDIVTGKELWSWNQNDIINNNFYSLKILNNGILYVDQYSRFERTNVFLALKTKLK